MMLSDGSFWYVNKVTAQVENAATPKLPDVEFSNDELQLVDEMLGDVQSQMKQGIESCNCETSSRACTRTTETVASREGETA